MSRVMGDAIHDNVPALRAAPVQMVAGYTTGTPDIQWTQADWNLFLEVPRVTIDQGYRSPVMTSATVRDVEPGAWSAAAAVNRATWTAQRPTIYCDQTDLKSVIALGWHGDVWLAMSSNTPPTVPPTHLFDGTPIPPQITVVAQQYRFNVNSAYDLSIVFDPTWPSPKGTTVPTSYQPGSVGLVYSPAGQLQIYGVGQDLVLYLSDLNADLSASNTHAVTNPLTFA